MNRGFAKQAGTREYPSTHGYPCLRTCFLPIISPHLSALSIECAVLLWIGVVEILWENNEPGFRRTDGYPGTRGAITCRIQIPVLSSTGRVRPCIPAGYPGIV